MGFSFSDFSSAVKTGGPVTAEDVLAVRGLVWPDGAIDRSEAEAILALNRDAKDAAPE